MKTRIRQNGHGGGEAPHRRARIRDFQGNKSSGRLKEMRETRWRPLPPHPTNDDNVAEIVHQGPQVLTSGERTQRVLAIIAGYLPLAPGKTERDRFFAVGEDPLASHAHLAQQVLARYGDDVEIAYAGEVLMEGARMMLANHTSGSMAALLRPDDPHAVINDGRFLVGLADSILGIYFTRDFSVRAYDPKNEHLGNYGGVSGSYMRHEMWGVLENVGLLCRSILNNDIDNGDVAFEVLKEIMSPRTEQGNKLSAALLYLMGAGHLNLEEVGSMNLIFDFLNNHQNFGSFMSYWMGLSEDEKSQQDQALRDFPATLQKIKNLANFAPVEMIVLEDPA